MFNKKLICITGPDGSGKSTLIDGLLVHFPNSKKLGIWDAVAASPIKLFESKAAIDDYLCGLSPAARTFFLTHALQESMKGIQNGQETIIFLDSYYYKYYCSELALGTSMEIIQSVSGHFMKPDLVVLLNLDTEICASRKTKFTRYECGLALEPDVKAFIEFQKKCIENWSFFQEDTWVTIDANNTAEKMLETTIKNIAILCKST